MMNEKELFELNLEYIEINQEILDCVKDLINTLKEINPIEINPESIDNYAIVINNKLVEIIQYYKAKGLNFFDEEGIITLMIINYCSFHFEQLFKKLFEIMNSIGIFLIDECEKSKQLSYFKKLLLIIKIENGEKTL